MKDAFEWMRNRKPTIKEAVTKYHGLRMRGEAPGIDRSFEAYLLYAQVITNSQFKLIESTIADWQICRHCKHWDIDGDCIPLQVELDIEIDSGGYEKAFVTYISTHPAFGCKLWTPIISK